MARLVSLGYSSLQYEMSEFFWEDVAETQLKANEDCFQFVEGDVVFTALDAMKRCVRDVELFRECGKRKAAAFLSQKSCQLAVQIASHSPTVPKVSSRMRDEVKLFC